MSHELNQISRQPWIIHGCLPPFHPSIMDGWMDGTERDGRLAIRPPSGYSRVGIRRKAARPHSFSSSPEKSALWRLSIVPRGPVPLFHARALPSLVCCARQPFRVWCARQTFRGKATQQQTLNVSEDHFATGSRHTVLLCQALPKVRRELQGRKSKAQACTCSPPGSRMRISAASARRVMYACLAAPLLAFSARVMVGNVDVKDPFHAYRAQTPGQHAAPPPHLVQAPANSQEG